MHPLPVSHIIEITAQGRISASYDKNDILGLDIFVYEATQLRILSIPATRLSEGVNIVYQAL